MPWIGRLGLHGISLSNPGHIKVIINATPSKANCQLGICTSDLGETLWGFRCGGWLPNKMHLLNQQNRKIPSRDSISGAWFQDICRWCWWLLIWDAHLLQLPQFSKGDTPRLVAAVICLFRGRLWKVLSGASQASTTRAHIKLIFQHNFLCCSPNSLLQTTSPKANIWVEESNSYQPRHHLGPVYECVISGVWNGYSNTYNVFRVDEIRQ